VEVRLKAAAPDERVYFRGRVKIQLHWIPYKAQREIGERAHNTHPPKISGKDRAIESGRFICRLADQGMHVGVATDDAVKSDNASRRQIRGQGHKIALPALDSVSKSPLLCFRPGYPDVFRRGVNLGGGSDAALEELERDGTDSAADIQQRETIYSLRGQGGPFRR